MDYRMVIKKAVSGLMGKYSVKELADELEVSQSNVFRWLNGETKPSGDSMVKILALYEDITGKSFKDLLK
ncbi:MAG: helix-turn-helix domain-containing protein [Bacilli bacterium]|nr:helix-turn-helix domain-containing protein [Bacilli bacterium]